MAIIIILKKAFDITVTALFGIVFVPFLGYYAHPIITLVVIAGLLIAIPLARRCVAPCRWRREHGWSLLMPGVGLWLRRRLVREDPVAAALSLRLAVAGGLAMYVLSNGLFMLGVVRYNNELRQAMRSEVSAVAYMRGPAGKTPLEKWQRSRLSQSLSAEEQERFERAWRMVERERWRKEIHSRAQYLPLDPARALLGYDNLTPSRQAQFDAAWHELHGSRK